MKIIISGGGTGGHIYPAIAIANEIKAQKPNVKLLFVGALGKMEMEKVPKAGYDIVGLPIAGIQRKLSLANFSFPLKLYKSIQEAKRVVENFQPDIAIGVGGYASGPLLRVANQKGIPTLIQEQNSFAGLTNKWLSKKAKKICVAYEGMERFFPKEKITLTGNPVRQDIIDLSGKRAKGFEFFNFNPSKKTVFVFGGSQGSRAINEAIAQNLDEFIQADTQLLWQTGKNTFEKPSNYDKLIQNPHIQVREFIYDMDLAYAMAEVILCRAGALAVSELCIVGKPAIFVPLPSAAEDHQTKNAQALVDKNAAEIVQNSESKKKLVNQALTLLNEPKKLSTFSENIRKLAKPNATKEIVKEVFKLV